MSQVNPSIDLVSFSCPHCGALAHQTWWKLYGDTYPNNEHPTVWNEGDIDAFIASISKGSAEIDLKALRKRLVASARGEVAISESPSDGIYGPRLVDNIDISECFSCERVAVWIRDRLVHPAMNLAPAPNEDIPEELRLDYQEAGKIVRLSPRGASALLRLVIQRLLGHLGGTGKNINDDIAALVARGLDVRIQQSLDIVRVIGNNAVHPGQIDMKDNVSTAMTLFNLVNLIADAMISQPKHVAAAYSALPKASREAIEKRDKKKP